MTFKKGVSPNPGGRPKIVQAIKELAMKKSPEAFERITQLLDDPDPRISLAAAKEILDRAYGRPAQAVEVSGTDGAPIVPIINLTLKPK
jgi:HEAT repeat protein